VKCSSFSFSAVSSRPRYTWGKPSLCTLAHQ
jgi:hypothetical protein